MPVMPVMPNRVPSLANVKALYDRATRAFRACPSMLARTALEAAMTAYRMQSDTSAMHPLDDNRVGACVAFKAQYEAAMDAVVRVESCRS